MPRRVPLPEHLKGTAFPTSDASVHNLKRARLRSADIDHPFHGVSAIELDLESVVGLCLAYQPRLKPHQYFSHVTAAALCRVPLPRAAMRTGSVHVAVRHGTRPRAAGVIGHHLDDPETSLAMIYGLPIIGPADTWCHLSTVLGADDLVAAGDFMLSGESVEEGRLAALCTLDEIQLAAARHATKRGARNISWALPKLRTGVDSRPESLLRLLLVAAGLPEPLIGHPTSVDDGRGVLRPDLKWERWRIVLEYEGEEHRANSRRFRSDITRRERFEAAGWRVIRVTADDLFVNPRAFLDRVRKIIASRTS